MSKENSTEERAFFDAISSRDVAKVRELVDDQPELLKSYDYQYYGATPLTRICSKDDRPMIEALLAFGADVNRRSDWAMGPWSPMHCAVFDGNKELAEILLQNGATLDVHSAAGLGRLDELARLLDAEPEWVGELGGDGCHPMHFAGSIEIAQLLLDRGAEIDARCIDHFSTPAQYHACNRPAVCRFLFQQGAKADIFSAVMSNDVDVVKRLLESDVNVLEKRVNRQFFPPGPEYEVDNIMTFTIGKDSTPLHAAARGNHSTMVGLLVDAGQSPDIVGGYDDATPLHIAAWNDHVEVAKALLDRGADRNVRSGKIHNNSPAGWAIVAGSADFFDFIMQQGVEVHDWFVKDAKAGVAGDFDQYRLVPKECRERMLTRLTN